MQPISIQVNNEIELCEVSEPDCKDLIERALLKNRISYYIRWAKASFFSRRKNVCIICINDSAKEEAENVIRAICDETGYSVKFLYKKTQYNYQ
ncbi:MAG: hypothetical protein NC417_12335 [Candidatus Gastranaerophilales bacterium]|nr:hypothetical protein [Candidatus Gastranaerophilales bacterium]